jgi:hypothetical protein
MYIRNEVGHLFFKEAELLFKGIQALRRFVVRESSTLFISVVIIRTTVLMESIPLPVCFGIFAVRCRVRQAVALGGGGGCSKLFRNEFFYLFFSDLDAIRQLGGLGRASGT